MTDKAVSFNFKGYKLNNKEALISFFYFLKFFSGKKIDFVEKIYFPKIGFNLKKINPSFLKNLLESVSLILGVSYYKLYCPKKIVHNYSPNKEQAKFWNTVYTKGLGEFFYRNKINPKDLINFPYKISKIKNLKQESFELNPQNRILVGIGGGKDSILTAELLKEEGKDITAFLVETQKSSDISKKTVSLLGIKSLIIKRYLDEKIFAKISGSYNGHVPISAAFAFLGYLAAVIYDYKYVVVGNEFSSNFGNLKYKLQWAISQTYPKLLLAIF